MPAPDRNWPTVEQVRAFCEVSDAGSYSRAAARLGKDRVAVNRLVGRLAESVGTGPLVAASTSGSATLTPQGEALLPFARRFLDSTRELLAQIAPPVRLSAYPTVAQRLVRNAPQLLGQAANIEFVAVADRLRRGGGDALVEDVASGRIDLAIAPSAMQRSGVQERVLYRWKLRIKLPGLAGAWHRKTITPADLKAFDLVASPTGHRSRDMLVRAFDDDNIPLRIAAETESQELLWDLAAHSHRHAAVLPSDAFAARDLSECPTLRSANTGSYAAQYSLYSRTVDGGKDPVADAIEKVAQTVIASLDGRAVRSSA